MKVFITIALFLSLDAWAGRIVPEILWKGNTLNTTGAAAAISGTDNISGSYSFGDTENSKDKDFESKYEQVEISGRGSFGNTVFEGYVKDKQQKQNDENFNYGYLSAIVGHKINDDLFLGGEFSHDKSKSSEYNEFSFSAVKKLEKNFLLGAGFERETISHLDLKRNTFTFGGGYLEQQKSAHEIYLRYTPQVEEKVDGSYNYSYENIGIYTRSTIHIEKWEFLVGLQVYNSYAEISSEDIDREFNYRNLYFSAQYLLTSQFSLVGGLSLANREYINNEDSEYNYTRELVSYNIQARFKHEAWQATIGIFLATEEYNYDSSGFNDDANYEQDTIALSLTRFI